jgi:hypothetical protein
MKSAMYAVVFLCGTLPLCADDLTGKVEAAGIVGGTYVSQGFGSHVILGGSAGYGLTSKAQVFGEFTFSPGSSFFGVRETFLDYLGGVKWNLKSSNKGDLYLSGGLGAGTDRFSGGGFSNSLSNFAIYAGVGYRIYVRKNWGIAPELRLMHYFGGDGDLNAAHYTASVFYEWGRK